MRGSLGVVMVYSPLYPKFFLLKNALNFVLKRIIAMATPGMGNTIND